MKARRTSAPASERNVRIMQRAQELIAAGKWWSAAIEQARKEIGHDRGR